MTPNLAGPGAWARLRTNRLLWPVAGLLALWIFNAFFIPTFFSLEMRDGHLYGTLVDVLNQGSKVMLLALGMTLVIATGGVDLSVGSVMAIAGSVAALVVTRTPLGFACAVPVALGLTALLGAGNGALVAFFGVQPIIATLVLMVTGRGIAMLLTGGQIITFDQPAFVGLANGHFLALPFTLTLVAVCALATAYATRRTAVGLFLEAVGESAAASRFCGVPARLVKVLAYAFSGLCAGIAGLIAASNIKAADASRVGEMMELDAIFAVVIGGTALSGGRFTLAGSLIGALLIQTLTTTLYQLGVSPAVATVPKALVILTVCLMQSPKFRAEFIRSKTLA